MHVVLIVVVVIAFFAIFWFVGPRHGHTSLNGRLNEWAWKRNAEGKGNFMTKPIHGEEAEPPKYLQEHDDRFKR